MIEILLYKLACIIIPGIVGVIVESRTNKYGKTYKVPENWGK